MFFTFFRFCFSSIYQMIASVFAWSFASSSFEKSKSAKFSSSLSFPLLTCFLLIVFSSPLQAKEIRELKCKDISNIQKAFLRHHVLHKKLTKDLKLRIIDQFFSQMDNEKVYFLQTDMNRIKNNYKRFFSGIQRGNCKELHKVYEIYSKRMNDRMLFAKNYLSKNFKLDKNISYLIDDELRKYPKNTAQANQKMIQFIQYQVANMSLFQEDLKKAVSQFTFILNIRHKKVKSSKPLLNSKEKRLCKEKSKNSFKACKPGNWYSFYLDSFSQSLDSHSSFMDKSDMEEFYISMNLEFEGIGATLSSRFGYTVVENLTPGGAAKKSKQIKKKDKILAVGQNSKDLVDIFGEDIEDVVSIIRGKKGTPVYLKILRKIEPKNKKEKATNKIFTVKLIRSQIQLEEKAASTSYHNLKKGGKLYKIGLIHVPSFYGSNFLGKSVTRDVRKLLKEANSKNIDSLVLDLSFNRGGSLDESVDLSGLFFSKGNVVKQSERTEERNIRSHTFTDRDERIFYNKPLVVLVNRLSASASEIVSGALQDYKRAVIVGGDHTFGKGSVQSVQPIGNLGALKTTIGLYFIPSGRSTQKTGVTSDISLPNIFSMDTIGEKNLDHVLPSKSIPAFKSQPYEIFSKKEKDNWKSVNKEMLQELKKASFKRVGKDKKFNKIKEQISDFKEKKDKKFIRISEILEDKKDNITKEMEEMSENDEMENKEKYYNRADIQEALKIARDLVILQNNNNSLVSNQTN